MKKHWTWLLVLAVLSLVVAVPALAAPPAPGNKGSGAEMGLQQRAGRALRATFQRRPARVMGTVVSIEGNTLVVENEQGTVKVLTDIFTRFVIPGVESPGIADVEAGNYIVAQGQRRGESFHANSVLVRPQKPRRLGGEVTAVGTDSFTLVTEEETVTVLVDDQTHFRFPGVEEPGLGDVVVGEKLLVIGQPTDEGAVLATLVIRSRPRVGEITGEVTTVGVASFTVERRGGAAVTFTVDEETVFLVPEIAEPTLADVQEGDTVRVRVQLEDETPVALRVVVVPPTAAALLGKMVSVEGSTVQVETRLEQIIAVQTDSTTQFVIPGIDGPTLADLREGDMLRIGGEWVDTETFHAWVIQVQSQGRVGKGNGRILSLGDAEFTLGSPHGTVRVLVNDETRYRFPDVDDPGFDDLEAGQQVGVAGLLQEDGSLLARWVGRRR